MPLHISAEFLLGTYQGHDIGGVPEAYPSPDRVFQAAVSAYHLSLCPVISDKDGEDGSDTRLRDALHWLEGNPPDAVFLPRAGFSTDRQSRNATVYRDKGYMEDKKYRPKKKPEPASTSVTYRGQDDGELLTWQWRHEPDRAIVEALSRILWEVPYLGESCSRVRISVTVTDTFPLRHSLMRNEAFGFDGLARRGNRVFRCPGEGRLEALEERYARLNPPLRKGRSSRKESEEEKNLLAAEPATEPVEEVSYSPPSDDRPVLRRPWPEFILLPASKDAEEDGTSPWQPLPENLVEWAVAMHRFLISQWGIDPPSSLTGTYRGVTERPANNVAIQILSDDMGNLVREEYRNLAPAFLLMLPEGMSEEEKSRLLDVCRRSEGKYLYFSRRIGRVRLGSPVYVPDGRLWKPPAEGTTRFWRPFPMAIAETRPMPPSADNRQWRAREAMYLSLAHVWRDTFGNAQQMQKDDLGYEQRIWTLERKAEAADSPVHVCGAKPTYTVNMQAYTHRVDRSNLVRGLNGLISFRGDDLDSAAMAVGQSRHLGGGLLLPVDLPSEYVIRDDKGRDVPAWMA